MRKSWCEEYNRNLTLEAELSKMNELSKTCSRLQNHCISLELKLQQYKEKFQNNRSCSNLDAPALNEFFVINDLKAQLQAKESSISKFREHIATLKGKKVSDNNKPVDNASVIAPGMFRLDLEPLSHRLKNNMEAHEDYLKKTKEHTNTLREIVEQARKQNPSDPYEDYACKFTIRVQEFCLFSANHDKSDVTYINDVNKSVKSKSGKSKKMEWKPTGNVFTSVGHRWLPTGRTFTIKGTKCHMTRITSYPIVPPKETSQTPVITPNPEVKVYRRRTKVAKSICFNDEPSILGSRPSNILEPKKKWGSDDIK
ncbi:hypothetical protein Tco_0971828 [Tanacetum coccineum]